MITSELLGFVPLPNLQQEQGLMMSRWLSVGFMLYERSGKFAPALGPCLWTAAMLSTLLHNLALSMTLSVCVLYYNVSVSTGLRNAIRQRSQGDDIDIHRGAS